MTPEERARQSAHDAAVRLSDTMRGLSRDSQIGVLAGAIRAAEQEAERQCLDMVHSYYVERMSIDQRRAVDQTVIAIRGAIRDRARGNQTEPA